MYFNSLPENECNKNYDIIISKSKHPLLFTIAIAFGIMEMVFKYSLDDYEMLDTGFIILYFQKQRH